MAWRRPAAAAALLAFPVLGALALALPRMPGEASDRALRLAEGASAAPRSIVLLGTSLSARAVWPEALARDLTACFAAPVTLRRVARPGASAAWGLTEAAAIGAAQPDLVLIEFAINDADIRDGLWPGEARTATAAIVAAIRDRAPRAGIILMTTNPVFGAGRLTRPWLAGYYIAYRGLADRTDTGLFDGYPRWRGIGRGAMADAVHPRPEAESGVVLAPLAALIGRAYGRTCGA